MEENTVKPGLFEKGGKLGWLHSTWDAFDTFLRVPATVTAKGSHVRDSIDIKRVMIIVVLAVIVFFLLLSVYLPLFSMYSSVG